jgi:uncharacterized protein YktB (UPF0637 family)
MARTHDLPQYTTDAMYMVIRQHARSSANPIENAEIFFYEKFQVKKGNNSFKLIMYIHSCSS